MFGWGRQPPSLRDRQVLGLKQNHQIVTVQENVRYRANFKNRWGNMNFLIELPPNFPAVAPSLRFEKQVQHAWVDGRGHIMHNEVRNWGPHSGMFFSFQKKRLFFFSLVVLRFSQISERLYKTICRCTTHSRCCETCVTNFFFFWQQKPKPKFLNDCSPMRLSKRKKGL